MTEIAVMRHGASHCLARCRRGRERGAIPYRRMRPRFWGAGLGNSNKNDPKRDGVDHYVGYQHKRLKRLRLALKRFHVPKEGRAT